VLLILVLLGVVDAFTPRIAISSKSFPTPTRIYGRKKKGKGGGGGGKGGRRQQIPQEKSLSKMIDLML